MSKIKIFIVILVVLKPQLFSQNFQIGLGAGFSSIISPSYFTNDPGHAFGIIIVDGIGESVFPSLGFKNTYSFNGKIKYNIPNTSFNIVSNLSYSKFAGSTIVTTSNETVENPSPPEVIRYKTDVKIGKSIFMIGLGGQWQMLNSNYSPYLMTEIFLNSFGETIYNFKNSFQEYEIANEGMTRIGGSIGFGMNMFLYRYLSFDLGFRYNIHNLTKNVKDEELIKTYSLQGIFLINLN